jgi:cysteine desulfurase/selenocysteine lyase
MHAHRKETTPPLDVERVRAQFPVLAERVHGKPLVYLDSAATTQKPRAVLEAMEHFHVTQNANVHRGVHLLSQRATDVYAAARQTVATFLNAPAPEEVVFLRGTTEAINLVAQSWGRNNVNPGDEIVVSAMEHHSNIVPWQMVCKERGATLKVLPMTDRGELVLEELDRLLGPRTRLVAVNHVSNALGTINPVRRIADAAHAVGALVLVDGAQAVAHVGVDVQALGCDFYAFSGHKLYGPWGIGALWGRRSVLERMAPWQGGGDMIESVSWERTTYAPVPSRFEAGTPNVAGAAGLAAAIRWFRALGQEAVEAHEQDLLRYGTGQLSTLGGLRVVGTAAEKTGILSFVMEDIHPHDVGTILDQRGVAIRTGHHCAQPLMKRLGLPATARASLGLYNTRADVDALVEGLLEVRRIFDCPTREPDEEHDVICVRGPCPCTEAA